MENLEYKPSNSTFIANHRAIFLKGTLDIPGSTSLSLSLFLYI